MENIIARLWFLKRLITCKNVKRMS